MSEKRLAVVTGATRGIGKAIALELLRQGRDVAALGRSESLLAALKREAADAGHTCDTFAVDIADTTKFADTLTSLAERDGGIGILVNNAGITRDNLLVRMSDAQFDEVLQVNLKAAFVAMRTCAKSMMRNKFGRIVNISSVSGVIGNAGQSNYAASKAGLIGMTKSVAREFAKKNVTANCVAPGFIKTDMIEQLPEAAMEAAKQMVPMRRIGCVEDIARAVAFLTDERTGYLTGQVLCVDVGMAM